MTALTNRIANRLELPLQLGHEHRALLDVANRPRPGAIKPDANLSAIAPLRLQLSSGSISVFGCRAHFDRLRPGDSRDPPQRISNEARFRRELALIVDVLELTT